MAGVEAVIPETLLNIAAAGGTLGIGIAAGIYLFRFLLEWIGGRMDKRAGHLDEEAERLSLGNQQLFENMQREIARLTKHSRSQDEKIRRLEERVEECDRERAELRAELAELKAYQQGTGDAKQTAQIIIADELRKARQP